MLCQLTGARVLPPLESLGEQQPLRESLVTLPGQGPCEQKPSLANCRFLPVFLRALAYDMLPKVNAAVIRSIIGSAVKGPIFAGGVRGDKI